MRKIFRPNSKIAVKLFIITALTFSAMLLCALLAQSYYYRHTYIMTKQRPISTEYKNMYDELNKSDMSAVAAAKILRKYQRRYGIEAMIFTSDGVTPLFWPEELSGYQYSHALDDGIAYYVSIFRPEIFEYPRGYAQGDFRTEDGTQYNTIAANALNGGMVLFVIAKEDISAPGLFDNYYIIVLLGGVMLSLALSYVFSLMISKPLVRINNIATDMAALDFSKKIKPAGNDELGQLGNSLNTLSEKLDSTLTDLSDTNLRLDTALMELTAANIKLEADIERERELERTRKEFVINVSHELKTPLAVIKGYSQALRDNIRHDKREHYLSQIVSQTDTMNKLVQDMLDLSKIESGQYKPYITSFDLILLTRNVIDSLRFLLEEKALTINCSFSDGKAIINADRLKLGQVIMNFMHNAIRHTPENGAIYVTVSTDGVSARLDVENEGKNIAPDKLDKVWDRFYREDAARDKKSGGTGLGLAISATILAMHGMDYGVENTERGVKFYFKGQNFPAPC